VNELIKTHHDEWDLLAEKLGELRSEAIAGRQHGEEGMSKEATTFYQHIIEVGFSSGTLDESQKTKFKELMEMVVDILQETIGSIDFWQNPDKQKRLRGLIKDAIAIAGMEELKENRERVAVEIMKLAKNRHEQLIAFQRTGGV
jgi:type I restriction enzyme R subunit